MMLTWHNFCINWLGLKHISSKTKLRVILLKYYIIFDHMSPKLRGSHPPLTEGYSDFFDITNGDVFTTKGDPQNIIGICGPSSFNLSYSLHDP